MSQAAIERGFTPPSSARAEQIASILAFQQGTRADKEYFGSLPVLFTQQTLGGRYAEATPFIGSPLKSALESGISGIRNLVTSITDRPFKPFTATESPSLQLSEYPSVEDADKALVKALQPERPSRIRWAVPTVLVATDLLANACFSAPIDTNKPTIVEPAKPVSTATAIGIGGPDIIKTGNPQIDEIGQRLSDPLIRGSVSEEEILKWNEAVKAKATAESNLATAEAQKPSAPSPEAPAVECNFLSKEFCNKVDIIEYKNAKGNLVWFIGVKKGVLPTGTPIFIPIAGGLRNDLNSPFWATVSDLVNDPTRTTYTFEGDLVFDTDRRVQPGEKIAITGKSGDTGRLESLGLKDYQFMVSGSSRNSNTGAPNPPEEQLKKWKELFPNAPVVKAEFPSDRVGEPSVQPRYTVTFEDTPPK